MKAHAPLNRAPSQMNVQTTSNDLTPTASASHPRTVSQLPAVTPLSPSLRRQQQQQQAGQSPMLQRTPGADGRSTQQQYMLQPRSAAPSIARGNSDVK